MRGCRGGGGGLGWEGGNLISDLRYIITVSHVNLPL